MFACLLLMARQSTSPVGRKPTMRSGLGWNRENVSLGMGSTWKM